MQRSVGKQFTELVEGPARFETKDTSAGCRSFRKRILRRHVG